jgi:hypothetical protein
MSICWFLEKTGLAHYFRWILDKTQRIVPRFVLLLMNRWFSDLQFKEHGILYFLLPLFWWY